MNKNSPFIPRFLVCQLKGIHTQCLVQGVGIYRDDEKRCSFALEMEGVWDAHMKVGVSFHISYQFIIIIYIHSQMKISSHSRQAAGNSSK